MAFHRCVPYLLLISGLSASIGCAPSPPPLVQVSGTVKLGDQPLLEGFMYFKTIATGNLERFEIVNGEFKGKALPGVRRVEIYANRRVTVEIDGKDVEVPENIIDRSFNLDSTLTAEVTSEGPNRFTFTVKKS